ncbi:unnamed protein product [Calicophoron daubneyi]
MSYPEDPCIYQSLLYLCKYADWGRASQSVGIRTARSKDRGCPARFTVIQNNGCLVVGPRCHNMKHNHFCSVMEYCLDPAVRRLSVNERADVVRMIKYGTPMSGIMQMVENEYGKYMTQKDVHNIRARYADTAVPAANWEQFAEVVSHGGRFRCTNSADGRIECVSFSLDEQVRLFTKYPEVICLDATYNVNRSRYCLLQFVITDGLGHGRAVMYSLMRSESAQMYGLAMDNLRSIMGCVNRIKTFVVDMHYAQMQALRSAFRSAKILLCHFHMTRAIRRKTKNRIIWGLVGRIMRTTSRVVFSHLCNRLRQKFPGFFIYFQRIWLSHVDKWAMCQTSGVISLGNLTNNRVESAHRWLKRDLFVGDTVFQCCKRIWLSARQTLVHYKCAVAASRIKRPTVPFNCDIAGLIPHLTRYAAEKLLREWRTRTRMDIRNGGGRWVIVAELLGAREMRNTVDTRFRRCSCMFNRLYSLPCRHLILVYIRRGISLKRLIDRSRWLESLQNGTEPPKIVYHAATTTARQSCPEIILLKRLREMKGTLSAQTYELLLSKSSTLFDLFQYVLRDEAGSTGNTNYIPPLRERIAGRCSDYETTSTVARPSTSSTQTKKSYAAPKRRLPAVDLDESEKENEQPTTSMSHS